MIMNEHGDNEVWSPVHGMPMYEASSLGRVRSLRSDPPRLLVPHLFKGYWHVQLKLKPGRERVKLAAHQLVAMAFHGPQSVGLVCRHLDGNPMNNHKDNIAYGTHKDNVRDSIRHGTAVCLRRGEKHMRAKLTYQQYVELLKTISDRQMSYAQIGRTFGLHPTYVGRIAAGRGRKGGATVSVSA